MRTLFQDVSFSLRSLQRTKGFTFVAVITLSLGIAANTVVFTVVNAVLLHPLPYHNPDRLVAFEWRYQNGGLNPDISAAAFFALNERARSFQSITVYAADRGVNLAAAGPPQYEHAQRVSADFFRTLGVAPAIGRGFSVEEDQVGGPHAMVLSYGLWRQDYNQNPGVLGKEVRINGENYTIVGVMPKEFHSYPDPDLWLPIRLNRSTAEPGSEYRVVARLKDGVSLQQAEQEIASSPEYEAVFPLPTLAAGVRLAPYKLEDSLVSRIRTSLYLLFGAVVFVLLIGCTNLALLLAVRAATRTHEFAIRAALGSSRVRLVRVFLMDGILISLCGGVIGTILGKELLPVITWLAPADLPLRVQLGIDRYVLLFTAGVSVATALLSGLPPALRVSRESLNDIIRQSSRTTGTSMRKSTLGRLLVPVQTGLTLFLLTGTVTLLHNFLQLQAIPPGFDPQHVLVAQISLATPGYTSSAATSRLLDELTGQIRNVPGVETVATVIGLPLEQGPAISMFPTDAADKAISIREEMQYRIVSPDYFRTLRTPLLAGRFFSDRDAAGSTPVALVSEGLARHWWPHESPLGRFVAVSNEPGGQITDAPREVVGVVADVREAGPERLPLPTVFVPMKQVPDSVTAFVNGFFPASIVVRARTSANLREPLSRVLAVADSNLALKSLRPLPQILSNSLARPRFYASLITAFGAFAMLLTAIGLYGLLSYQLTLRLKELGLRIALGAKRHQIIGTVLKQGLGLTVVGVLIGSLASLFLNKSLAAVIYNHNDIGLWSVAVAALLMMAIAFLASLLISIRTTAIEPMEVLRIE